MEIIKTIESEDGKRRVLIRRNQDGTFGFGEERWSEDPREESWIPYGRYSLAICDTAEHAEEEARTRVDWLVESNESLS